MVLMKYQTFAEEKNIENYFYIEDETATFVATFPSLFIYFNLLNKHFYGIY